MGEKVQKIKVGYNTTNTRVIASLESFRILV